jgi:hypothetical protein
MECPNCKSKDIIQEFKVIHNASNLERCCRQLINICKKCSIQFNSSTNDNNNLRKSIALMR